MADRRPRFSLIDIVLAAVLVALIAGFAHSLSMPVLLGGGGPGWVLVCLIGIAVWIPVWIVSRRWRSGRAERMPVRDRRPRYNLVDIVLVVAFVGVTAGFVRSLNPGIRGNANSLWICLVGFWVWCIAWAISRGSRSTTACAVCGRRFTLPKKSPAPPVCPWCRPMSLTPVQARREQAKGLWIIVVSLGLIAAFVGTMLYDSRAVVGPRDWIVLVLKAIGYVLGAATALFAGLVAVMLLRGRRIKSKRYALARARKVTGEFGEQATHGPIELWYSGSIDPFPLIAEAAETVRGRFDLMVGEPVGSRPPLRLFVFERRDALVTFHRETLSDFWNLDGAYSAGPARFATLTREVVPCRLGDPMRTARSLCAYHAIEAYKGYLPPFWLQHGIVSASASDGDHLSALDRKMTVALQKGSALGVELFALSATTLMRLIQGWYNHARYARFVQVKAQAWSVFEYLNGAEAPEARRRLFRAFLNELRPGEDVEALFRVHFGYGFDGLLEAWRAWVVARGVGTHVQPPADLERALTTRIIPLVADPSAKVMDRIRAIREMGGAGFAFGADSLVRLLENPGAIPREEIVWSLEMISGRALGDDVAAWEAWRATLPADATEPRDAVAVAETSS